MSKLFIITGHGGNDPGAIGNGYTEAELVRRLGKRIKELGGDQVTLGDTTVDWYSTNKLSQTKFEKGTEILELHLDSATPVTAHGGHVIIDADFNPDLYDNKLASMIGAMFPGRSSLIEKKNLRNSNAAQKLGVSYRLLECCFISHADDVNKFVKNIDTLAKKILDVFGIPVVTVSNPAPAPAKTVTATGTLAGKTVKIELTFKTEKDGTFKTLKVL